jgi:hypothetical protein
MITDSIILWNFTPYGLVEVHLRFEGIHCPRLHGRRAKQATSKKKIDLAL